MNVLVVDDNEVDQMLVSRALRSSPLLRESALAEVGKVYHVTSCAEVLKTFDGLYDCIVIDQNLSTGDNGVDCIKELRNAGFVGVIILISGYRFNDDRDVALAVKALQSGADDFVFKDKIGESLSSVVFAAMHRREDTMRSQSDLKMRTREFDKMLGGLQGLEDNINKKVSNG